MPTLSRFLRLTLSVLLIVAGAVLVAILAMRHAERQAQEDDAERANQQLALYANSLHTLIERYRAATRRLSDHARGHAEKALDRFAMNSTNEPGSLRCK